jgi:hypothetical protein
VTLPEREARYLRVDWPRRLADVSLAGVRATFSAPVQPLPRQWLRIPGRPDPDDVRAFLAEAGGHFPVDRVNLALPGRNPVAEARIDSRAGPAADAQRPAKPAWRTRGRAVFYRLDSAAQASAGAARRNPPLEIPLVRDPEWRIVLIGDTPVPVDAPTELELGWLADVVTFVAQGEPPYMLAFGSATVESSTGAAPGLFRDIGGEDRVAAPSPATLGTRVELGGAARLVPPPPPLPWQRWLLWAVLGVGVLFLAWMVRRLSREMSGPSEKPAD